MRKLTSHGSRSVIRPLLALILLVLLGSAFLGLQRNAFASSSHKTGEGKPVLSVSPSSIAVSANSSNCTVWGRAELICTFTLTNQSDHAPLAWTATSIVSPAMSSTSGTLAAKGTASVSIVLYGDQGYCYPGATIPITFTGPTNTVTVKLVCWVPFLQYAIQRRKSFLIVVLHTAKPFVKHISFTCPTLQTFCSASPSPLSAWLEKHASRYPTSCWFQRVQGYLARSLDAHPC